MTRVNPYILTTLRHRFDEQVSEADILEWLYNFEEQDWELVLTLLNRVTFYSEHRMSAVLESGLKEIVTDHSQEKMLICPVGGIGKSGGVISYIVKMLMGRFCKVSWKFYDEGTIIKNEPYKVVLPDDFVGTGGSAMKTWRLSACSWIRPVSRLVLYGNQCINSRYMLRLQRMSTA